MHIVIDNAKLKTYKTTIPKPTEDDDDPEPVTSLQIDIVGMDASDVGALHRLMRGADLTLVLSTTQMELGDVFGGTAGRRDQAKAADSVTIGVKPSGEPARSVTFTREDRLRVAALVRDIERDANGRQPARNIKDRLGDEFEAAGFTVERDAAISVVDEETGELFEGREAVARGMGNAARRALDRKVKAGRNGTATLTMTMTPAQAALDAHSREWHATSGASPRTCEECGDLILAVERERSQVNGTGPTGPTEPADVLDTILDRSATAGSEPVSVGEVGE